MNLIRPIVGRLKVFGSLPLIKAKSETSNRTAPLLEGEKASSPGKSRSMGFLILEIFLVSVLVYFWL
jgi:hypothetical protein